MDSYYRLTKNNTASQPYHFVLVAPNTETILSSESYTSKSMALVGIESVKENSPLDSRYDRRTSRDNKPYFVLKGANGEIIGTSEMYSSHQAMETGIRAVKKDGPIAVIKDET